ncbi:MAG: ABC-F family ATP-binding cassette domain-containing protein [Pleurocapsa minor GSE-CHR-MK-17-07R]|jgi:ATP-binding cassette subfamily F protein 3|nr:ABC-F family ATP-binding cassette domain-containing protein [Pleurocapsa minor GSE-CHR-MK 17-07R]
MSLIVGSGLTKYFGPEEIFSGISVSVPKDSRIALVGPNGAGKTTLLNILAGLDTPSEGSVTRAKNTRIGYLTQRPELLGTHTIHEEVLRAFDGLRAMEDDLHAHADALATATDHESALAAYGALQERFEAAGGYTYEQRLKTVLTGLGFTPDDYNTRLDTLSGGQKTRVLLGRLLLEEPDVLALDEPTNHLDIGAVEWLEGYLRDFPGAVVIVSHDRYFLDAVSQTTWELDFGSLESYKGNYSAYTRQREERHERLLKEFSAQQEFIAKEEEYIRRNIAGQNTRQAKGRRARLERLKRDDLVLRPRSRKDFTVHLNTGLRSGDLVLRTFGLRVGYPGKPLFSPPDIVLRRGEVAALIGPNGAGKSTFVKTALGALSPLAGEVKIGAAVKIGYFAQAQELLNPQNSILDEITSAKSMGLNEARSYLGKFLFEGDDVFRTIDTLSGGERGRVALAKLALSGANFLMLDEPTNHLDIASQEALQNVLAAFDGTILLVSHDRYLIDALATQIWAVRDGALDVFAGSYQEYLAKREHDRLLAAAAREAEKNASRPAPAKAPGQRKMGLNPFELARRIESVEAEITALETQLAGIHAELERASAAGDAKRVHVLGDQYTQVEATLNAAMDQWALLSD